MLTRGRYQATVAVVVSEPISMVFAFISVYLCSSVVPKGVK